MAKLRDVHEGGGSGAVESVNSKVGVVTLAYTDVGADVSGAAASEEIRAKAAEKTEKEAREAETTARVTGDSTEKAAREGADKTEKEAREAETTARVTGDSTEKAAREGADKTEKEAREAEETRAKASEKSEKEAREAAVTAEASTRSIADTNEKAVRESGDSTEKAAREAGDALLIPLAQRAVANGVATLDGAGLLKTDQLPPLSITSSFVVASESEQIALSTQEGDVVIRTDQNKTYIKKNSSFGTMADYRELLFPAPVVSVNAKTGAVTLSFADVGADALGSAAAAQTTAEAVSTSETTRAKVAEKAEKEAREAEEARAKAAEKVNGESVTTEETRAKAAEKTEKEAREGAISTESAARVAADALALQKANNLIDVASSGAARGNLKVPVLSGCATVAISNVSVLEGLGTYNGYTLESEDIILLAGQTTKSQNGPWIAAVGAWTRPTDFAHELQTKSRATAVLKGTYKFTFWILSTTKTLTVDVSDQTWEPTQKRRSRSAHAWVWRRTEEVSAETVDGIVVRMSEFEEQFITSVDYKIASGTEVTFKLQRTNTAGETSDLTGFTALVAKTAAKTTAPTAVSLANGDEISVVTSSPAGTPKGLRVSLCVEHVS